jgi:hypothetical protein
MVDWPINLQVLTQLYTMHQQEMSWQVVQMTHATSRAHPELAQDMFCKWVQMPRDLYSSPFRSNICFCICVPITQWSADSDAWVGVVMAGHCNGCDLWLSYAYRGWSEKLVISRVSNWGIWAHFFTVFIPNSSLIRQTLRRGCRRGLISATL